MSDTRSDDLDRSPAYLSIGGNVGERESFVLRAANELVNVGAAAAVRLSALFETEPVGCGSQQVFVNAVAELQPLLCPIDLIKRLQAIERSMGRTGGHNEPREVDLDIIAFGDRIIDADGLIVPHPRYRERAFVLIPLREIAPDYRCPQTRASIDELIEALPPGQRISRISDRKIVFG